MVDCQLINESLYAGTTFILNTMHAKELAVAPAFFRHLGAHVQASGLNTDVFGTFSGEKKRRGTPLSCVRRKCLQGIRKSGIPFGLASEGSFGPHPEPPYLRSNYEIIYFIDTTRKIELHCSEISLDTNFAGRCFESLAEIDSFLASVSFPEHGVLLRPHYGRRKNRHLYKGITSRAQLAQAFKDAQAASSDRRVWIETDMRAHMNPTRMQVISRVAERLARRLSCQCPACGAPGWGVIKRIPGLPCELCSFPTQLTQKIIDGCPRCTHRREATPEHGLIRADAMICERCNP